MLNLKFKKRYLVVACGAIWLAGCNSGSSAPSSSGTTGCNPCTMFVTESAYAGNLVESVNTYPNLGHPTESIGVYAADYLCNVDANKPADGHTYKAFITDGVNRVACTSANCIDANGTSENVNWVLHPNTTYLWNGNPESPVFTSNSNGIYVFGLISTVPVALNGTTYWTGFGEPHLTPWTTPTASNSCAAWGTTGNAGTANNAAIGGLDIAEMTNQLTAQGFTRGQGNGDNPGANQGCDQVEQLLCVAQ